MMIRHQVARRLANRAIQARNSTSINARGVHQRATTSFGFTPLLHKVVISPICQQHTTVKFYSTEQQVHTQNNNHNNNNNADSLKIELLTEALKHVHNHGWTIEALNEAARQLNLSPMAVSQLCGNADYELIEFFITKCNQNMSRTIQLMDTTNMQAKDIIKLAIRTRLEMVTPYVQTGTWPQAMSSFIFGKHPLDIFSQVFNHLTSTASAGGSSTNMAQTSITGFNATYHLAILADELCFLAGQKETNINWYAQRGVIGMIYASTEFYMLTDKSDGFSDTWRFLNNRVEEAFALKSYADSFFGDLSFWAKNFESMWGLNQPLNPDDVQKRQSTNYPSPSNPSKL